MHTQHTHRNDCICSYFLIPLLDKEYSSRATLLRRVYNPWTVGVCACRLQILQRVREIGLGERTSAVTHPIACALP